MKPPLPLLLAPPPPRAAAPPSFKPTLCAAHEAGGGVLCGRVFVPGHARAGPAGPSSARPKERGGRGNGALPRAEPPRVAPAGVCKWRMAASKAAGPPT